MSDTVYSIGYSGFKIDELIDILKKEEISLVVDIRSNPYSNYYTDYDKDVLEKKLWKNRIYYRNYAEEFGARQNDRQYYPSGYLDFELFAKSHKFLEGIRKLKESMQQKYKFVLMCAEKDPIRCHRAILVTKTFHELGYKVKHILPGDVKMTQIDVENRLLNTFFPDRHQLTFFEKNFSDKDYIAKAYKLCNAKIGYSFEEEKE